MPPSRRDLILLGTGAAAALLCGRAQAQVARHRSRSGVESFRPRALLPLPVGRWPRLNNAAPSLRPRYRALDALPRLPAD
jgi:hypothetical protein